MRYLLSMPLQTHESLDAGTMAELVQKVRDIGSATDCKGPCPDAKAESHEQARALGIVLVEAQSESLTPRQRLHPMA
jgi:hypothetical protein